MLCVSGCVFDLTNYSAGLLWLTRLNLAFCPHVNNTKEWVWRASNHGDRHSHWHGDEAQQWPSTSWTPWCDPRWAIIDAILTGHCIHCCIRQTGNWFKELVCVCVCLCLCEQRWVIVLATVCMSSIYTHCGRKSEEVNEIPTDSEIIWLDTYTRHNV